MAEAHFMRAAPRPEYSRVLECPIMAISVCPDGLSTGMRDSSAMISRTNATTTST